MSLAERLRGGSHTMKIIIAGPKAVGKTLIANYLAGQTDKLTSSQYDPTQGCRILEFESRMSSSDTINVELWDASGDHSYESCWKAIMHEADGVILVFNPDAPSQDQQLADWYDFFVHKNGLKDEQCMIFAHRGEKGSTSDKFRPPPLFSKVTAALTTAQSGPDIKGMFETFLKDIRLVTSSQKRK